MGEEGGRLHWGQWSSALGTWRTGRSSPHSLGVCQRGGLLGGAHRSQHHPRLYTEAWHIMIVTGLCGDQVRKAPTWTRVFLARQWELIHLVCIMLPPFASVTLSRSSFVTGILPPCSASRAPGWEWPSLTACLGQWELICCWPTAARTQWEGSGRGVALWLPGAGGQCLPPASSVPGPSPGARRAGLGIKVINKADVASVFLTALPAR